MKSYVMTDMQKLAFDAANGVTREGMSKEQLNNAVRTAIVDACGGEWNVYNFLANRYKVFAIMSEIMPVAMHASLAGKFDQFAEFKDEALGDKNYFVVEDPAIFPVVTVARGNQDISRNKIIDKNFKVDTLTKGIKFYDELDSFIRGKMDLARMTEKATIAMSNYVGELIATTIYGSYSAIGSDYKTTGSFDATTLAAMIEQVKAANGVNAVQVFGTTTALSSVADGFGYSDSAKDAANQWGYYGQFRGTTLIALPQAYTAGAVGTLHVNTTHLVVLPANEKIVKVVFEGDAFVNMNDTMSRNDLQQEVTFTRKVGAAAITVVTGKYGMYKFS